MRNHRILVLAPQSPPYGGVANQASLLVKSASFVKEFHAEVIRTNPFKSVENPSAPKKGSLIHAWRTLRLTLKELRREDYSAIQLIANGDASFLRDMLVALIAKVMFHLPLAVHLHGSKRGFWHNRSLNKGNVEQIKEDGIIGRVAYRFCSFLLKRADSLSQLTEQIDKFYRTKGFPQADTIIPNASAHRAPFFEKSRSSSLLFVGRLTEEKGIFDLVQSLACLKSGEWKLNILGDYSREADKRKMDAIIKNHPWKDNIVFQGVVTGKEKWNFYRNASIFVLPSYVEVFPVVLLEAMGMGCAVISTNVGEISSIVPEPSLCLVKAGDTAAIGKLVSDFLKNGSETTRLGRNNYLHSKQYEIGTVATKFARQLHEIIGVNK